MSRQQIWDLLEFHALKFYYEGRTPYAASRVASPLASRMLEAMQDGPKLTMLVGHDTNIADLGGFLDRNWKVPSCPRDDPPPGGALGFEVLSDASAKQFVRAFYRSQTMGRVRGLQPLSAANAPSREYLPIPGCALPCPMAEFEDTVRMKRVDRLTPRPKAYIRDQPGRPIERYLSNPAICYGEFTRNSSMRMEPLRTLRRHCRPRKS